MNAELLAHQNEQLLEEIEDLKEQLATAHDKEREMAQLAADYKAEACSLRTELMTRMLLV